MKEDIKTIDSNKGLGKLLFGMTKEEVKQLIGDPFEVEKHSEGEGEEVFAIEIWHYDGLEMSIGFEEEENWALMSISITSTHYEIGEVALIGKSMEEVTEQLGKWGVIDIETEDHSDEESPNHKLIVSDYLGMIFWFDNDIATEISWTPLYEEDTAIELEA